MPHPGMRTPHIWTVWRHGGKQTPPKNVHFAAMMCILGLQHISPLPIAEPKPSSQSRYCDSSLGRGPVYARVGAIGRNNAARRDFSVDASFVSQPLPFGR